MALNCSRKLRIAVLNTFRCERLAHSKLRGYVGAGLIILIATVIFLVCFHVLFHFILMVVNGIDAAVENLGRSIHSLEIQRFDDDFHVETVIDPKLQVTRLFLTSKQPKTCNPRDTVKDFEKGTEVFVENDNCFVRFFNYSEESYDQQMLLFQNQDEDTPMDQSVEPAIYEAVQHLQFTDNLYEMLGRQVAALCNLRRLLWLVPAAPHRARNLTACRCFDTLHARLRVCLQSAAELARRANPWGVVTTEQNSTGLTDSGQGDERYPRSLDRILRKPADLKMLE